MRNWRHKIKIRHLFTKKEDYLSVQSSMNKIADVLENDCWFRGCTWIENFRKIPKGSDIMAPVDYANKLLDRMWDYCDANDIWVEF